MTKLFVNTMATAICSQFPSSPVDTALALVAEVARRQRLAAVRDFARGKEPTHISRPHQVVAAVCRGYAVTQEEVLGPTRRRRVTVPRWVAWRVMHRELSMSSKDIAAMFNRDHTTVLHGLARAEAIADLSQHATEIGDRLRAQWEMDSVEAAE